MNNVVQLFPPPPIRQAPPFPSDGLTSFSLQTPPGDPRGPFETAVNRIICQGHIDLGRKILRVYVGFCRPGQVPSAAEIGMCAGLLAKVPADDPMALGLARRAWEALGELAFPQSQPNEVA